MNNFIYLMLYLYSNSCKNCHIPFSCVCLSSWRYIWRSKVTFFFSSSHNYLSRIISQEGTVLIKFGVMSATEGTDSYSLDHPVNIFSVRKSLFSGTALQETCIFILINLCLDFFWNWFLFVFKHWGLFYLFWAELWKEIILGEGFFPSQKLSWFQEFVW